MPQDSAALNNLTVAEALTTPPTCAASSRRRPPRAGRPPGLWGLGPLRAPFHAPVGRGAPPPAAGRGHRRALVRPDPRRAHQRPRPLRRRLVWRCCAAERRARHHHPLYHPRRHRGGAHRRAGGHPARRAAGHLGRPADLKRAVDRKIRLAAPCLRPPARFGRTRRVAHRPAGAGRGAPDRSEVGAVLEGLDLRPSTTFASILRRWRPHVYYATNLRGALGPAGGVALAGGDVTLRMVSPTGAEWRSLLMTATLSPLISVLAGGSRGIRAARRWSTS